MGLFDVSDSDDDCEIVGSGGTDPAVTADSRGTDPAGNGIAATASSSNTCAVDTAMPCAPSKRLGPVPSDGKAAMPCAPSKRRRTSTKRATGEMVVRKSTPGTMTPVDALFVTGHAGKAPTPVLLWPQFTFGADGAESWLHVSPQESWFIDLVQTISPKRSVSSLRIVTQNCFHAMRVEIRDALRLARKCVHMCEDSGSGDDFSGEEDSRAGREVSAKKLTLRKVLNLPIKIGTCTVTMFNTERPLFLKFDSAAAHYLGTRAVLLIKHLAASGPVDDLAAKVPDDAPFQTSALELPNIRGKLTWCCSVHAWKLEILRPRRPWKQHVDISGETLFVNSTLTAQEYRAAKLDAYIRAVRTWNELDGSKRHRIPSPTCGSSQSCVADTSPK